MLSEFLRCCKSQKQTTEDQQSKHNVFDGSLEDEYTRIAKEYRKTDPYLGTLFQIR